MEAGRRLFGSDKPVVVDGTKGEAPSELVASYLDKPHRMAGDLPDLPREKSVVVQPSELIFESNGPPATDPFHSPIPATLVVTNDNSKGEEAAVGSGGGRVASGQRWRQTVQYGGVGGKGGEKEALYLCASWRGVGGCGGLGGPLAGGVHRQDDGTGGAAG
eukprot:SAG22_NODE_1535_length_4200_cov_301.283346_5_plen_161_part_00